RREEILGRSELVSAPSALNTALEPNTKGPGPHSHDEDDVFFIIAGTMSVLVGDRWVDAPRGSFVLIPGGVRHDFENRSDERAGLLNFTPGEFESEMPAIAEWFAEHPPGPARPTGVMPTP